MPSKTLGLENDTVQLVAYQPDWERAFLEEKAQLREAFGSALLDVQHISSTAVPGLPAKPILDIGVAVRDFDEAFTLIEPLEVLDYRYRGEYGISRRHYFVKGSPRTHHLHMLEAHSPEWRNHLHFRDYLRAHLEAVAAYGALKMQLAEQFPENRDAYTEGKHAFIQYILHRAE